MDAFFSGFEVIFHVQYIGYMFAGVLFGLVLGFLPGLNGGIGIALMLPFTYEMESLSALVFLLSIYTGSLFGGAVTAILFNTPGSAANIATTFDGYPMNLNGEAERAMGLALMSSFFGGIVGCVCLLLVAEPMARFSLRFGPGEMFMVAIFGLSVIGSLSSNALKSLLVGFFGLLLGTVGTSASGSIRGTMGIVYLIDGVPLVPALIGLLALPEIYAQMVNKYQFDAVEMRRDSIARFFKGELEMFKYIIRAAICSIAGVVIGIMPAAGASVASMLCYNQSKQLSSKPERYGTGIPEGIVSCETANNASEGGALATMFVLGIPGSNATAMMLGALVLQGWTPGPKLFVDHSNIIYTAFSSLFVQQFVMLLLGAALCLLAAQIIRLPFIYLMPCIVVFTVLGAFSGRYLLFDPMLMLLFSFVGWMMKKNGFPTVPMILGLLLGAIADVELMRIYQAFDCFWEIFRSPIVCVLAFLSIAGALYPLVVKRVSRKNN